MIVRPQFLWLSDCEDPDCARLPRPCLSIQPLLLTFPPRPVLRVDTHLHQIRGHQNCDLRICRCTHVRRRSVVGPHLCHAIVTPSFVSAKLPSKPQHGLSDSVHCAALLSPIFSNSRRPAPLLFQYPPFSLHALSIKSPSNAFQRPTTPLFFPPSSLLFTFLAIPKRNPSLPSFSSIHPACRHSQDVSPPRSISLPLSSALYRRLNRYRLFLLYHCTLLFRHLFRRFDHHSSRPRESGQNTVAP